MKLFGLSIKPWLLNNSRSLHFTLKTLNQSAVKILANYQHDLCTTHRKTLVSHLLPNNNTCDTCNRGFSSFSFSLFVSTLFICLLAGFVSLAANYSGHLTVRQPNNGARNATSFPLTHCQIIFRYHSVCLLLIESRRDRPDQTGFFQPAS